MRHESFQEKRVKTFIYLAIGSVLVLFLSQVFFLHLRFHLLNAEKEVLTLKEEVCDASNCTGKWELTPKKKLLLLGHIMRTHKLWDLRNNQQVLPISRVRGITADSWSGLRVYSVEPGETYVLEATKPKAVRMGYFIGILPRSSDHEGILSVPDISPTIATITTLSGFGLLGLLLFAAFLAPKSGADARKNRDDLMAIALTSVAAAVVALINSGLVDSLMPDGELRSRILRTSFLIAAFGYPLFGLVRNSFKENIYTLLFVVLSIAVIVNSFWSSLRAGIPYILAYSFCIVSLAVFYWNRNHKMLTILLLVCIWDPLYMSGFVSSLDIPPMYLLSLGITSCSSIHLANIGAVSVISLASRAYSRFTRDLVLKDVSQILNPGGVDQTQDISTRVQQILPKLASIMGANRVSVLINLPFARPITHSFLASQQKITTFDDGKVPGAITIRALVYGDEAWFETIDSFVSRLDIKQPRLHQDSEYLCIAPIRVHESYAGVLMLTGFDDEHIRSIISNQQIDDAKETGRLLMDELSKSLSKAVLGDLNVTSSQSSSLLSSIREMIAGSSSAAEFVWKYCEAVSSVTGMRVALHHQVDQKAFAIAQHGFMDWEWEYFTKVPLNLDPTKGHLGGTVVAFIEGKSSYTKDWREISDKLHPRTNQIFEEIQVKSILAVPLKCGSQRFVVTMLSHTNEPPKDSGTMKIVESTEAIFDAAMTVLEQRTSVVALGKLANRLIGDDTVREQILAAAKEPTLPTTIGSPRTSFLLLFDLVGSTDFAGDAEAKARSYGVFYDEVNTAVHRYLGGKIRKTIGDAVIATWDGTTINLAERQELLSDLVNVAQIADSIAKNVGCKGSRAILHYGDYFFGLVGTASFGQIDVIGRGIDEVCKLEGTAKLLSSSGQRLAVGISVGAASRLPLLQSHELVSHGFKQVLQETGQLSQSKFSQTKNPEGGIAWISFMETYSVEPSQLPALILESKHAQPRHATKRPA